MSDPPSLVLGPLLRYVSETAVTIWVEASRACTVEILGHRARTFEVTGHHYGLVVADGLRPASQHEYQIALDGTVCWPEPDSRFPPSVLRTPHPDRPLRLAFGSCRIAELPVRPRRGNGQPGPEAEHGPDALRALAFDLRQAPRERWPDAMLLIGDQVYADDPGPRTRQFIAQRRDPASPPGYQVADFTEYCALYREAWSEPAVRWLLSVIPTAMIFDDHDVHDDWNTSAAWRREFSAEPWWQARISGAYVSYWLYQHLGNLSPAELSADPLWRQVREHSGDVSAVLGDFASRADRQAEDIRWNFSRRFGRVRVVMIDSRSDRVLNEGSRRMTSVAQWRQVTDAVTGDWDHVVLATSLPVLLPTGIHDLEAWDEAVCGGAWGKRLTKAGERLRRAVDLEHWAAFGTSFTECERLLAELAAGAHGQPPESVTIVSGDVHHSYLAPVAFPAGTARSAVFQAVCSPIHNMLPGSFRRMHRLASSGPGEAIARIVARLAGVRRPAIRWRITRGPWFDNMLATLEFDGRSASIRFDRAVCGTDQSPRLETVCQTDLAEGLDRARQHGEPDPSALP